MSTMSIPIAAAASTHPSLSTSPHRRPTSSSPPSSSRSGSLPKAVRFAPYSTSPPSISLHTSSTPLHRSHSRSTPSILHVRNQGDRERYRTSPNINANHLEVHVRDSRSPSPSALSAGTGRGSDRSRSTSRSASPNLRVRYQGRQQRLGGDGEDGDASMSPSPGPRDSISTATASDGDAESDTGGEILGMNRLALGGMPLRPILKPSSRRAKPPAPLRSTHVRTHQRAHSFSTLPSQPASVGYMLCPSPRSATFGRSQKDIQLQAQVQAGSQPRVQQTDAGQGQWSSLSPVRGTFPPISLNLDPHGSGGAAPMHRPRHGSRSPRSPLASRPAGLDTINELGPIHAPLTFHTPSHTDDETAVEPSDTVLPSRRHSTYTYAPTTTAAPSSKLTGQDIRHTSSPNKSVPSDMQLRPDSQAQAKAKAQAQMSLERMMLVNPAIAAHLKRGGVVSVRSVDGSKSWKIRMTEEQIAAMRERERARA